MGCAVVGVGKAGSPIATARDADAEQPAPYSLLLQLGLGAASGLTIAACFPPVGIAHAAFVGLIPLLCVADRGTIIGAALGGLVAGACFYAVAFAPVLPALADLQAVPWAGALPAFLIFVGSHALQWSVFAIGVWYLNPGSSVTALGGAAWWVVLEWAFPHIFPWSLGAALGPSRLLRQGVDVAGVYGLSFLIVMINLLLMQSVRRWSSNRIPRWQPISFVAIATVATLLYGSARLENVAGRGDGSLRVAIVQGGISRLRLEDLDAAKSSASERYRAATAALRGQHLDVVVWPESAVPIFVSRNPAVRKDLTALSTEVGAALLLGALDQTPDATRELNSVYLVQDTDDEAADPGSDGSLLPAVYHKTALVPFAEYWPVWARWLQGTWRTTGDFAAGGAAPPLRLWASQDHAGVLFAASICYEAILAGWFNRLVQDGASLLANVTDDSWFAGTSLPASHLELTRLRAVETRRWLVRASGSGISAIVDPTGEIVASLPVGTIGTITEHVETRHDITPYVRFGDWIIGVSLLIVLLQVAVRQHWLAARLVRSPRFHRGGAQRPNS